MVRENASSAPPPESMLIRPWLVLVLAAMICAAAEPRTWTSQDGKTFQGVLVEADASTVTLRSTASGKVYTIPRTMLSPGDLAYLDRVDEAGPAAAAEAAPVADARGPQQEAADADAAAADVVQQVADAVELKLNINVPLLIALVLLNIPVYIFVWGSLFFGDLGGLVRALRFWVTPDIISLFRGEYCEDRWSEFMLFLFLAACAATVFAEYYGITRYILPRFAG